MYQPPLFSARATAARGRLGTECETVAPGRHEVVHHQGVLRVVDDLATVGEA